MGITRYIITKNSEGTATQWVALGRAETSLARAKARKSYNGSKSRYSKKAWTKTGDWDGPTNFLNTATSRDEGPTRIVRLERA